MGSILSLVHNGVGKEDVQQTRRDPLSRTTSDPRSPSSLSTLRRHCDGQSSDANADANRRSEPVGCCRSNCPVCSQETVPDGSCRVTYAFWKCGWWATRHEGSNPSRTGFPLQYKELRLIKQRDLLAPHGA
jgi:hypothetical protein